MDNSIKIFLKIKSPKAILLAIFVIGLTVATISIVSSANLSPKVGDVLGNKEVTVFDLDENGLPVPGTAKIAVKYAYVGGPMDQNISLQSKRQAQKNGLQITGEVTSLRTAHSRTFKTNDSNKFVTEVISGVPQYYKDSNGLWWQADYEITSLEKFAKLPKSPLFRQWHPDNIFALVARVFALSDEFYPDPDPELTSVDGTVIAKDRSTWDNAHDANTGDLAESDFTPVNTGVSGDSLDRVTLNRAFVLFDTSSITDNDTISSASIDIWFTVVYDDDPDAQESYLNIVKATPASNNNLIVEDYDQCGAVDNPVKQASDIDITSIVPEEYTSFTLNATGTSNISKTGITRFGIREGHDIEDVSIELGGAAIDEYGRFSTSEEGGDYHDPKLVIVHSFPILGLEAYKSTDQATTSSTILQQDDELGLSLEANETYMINGVIFASSTSNTPDIKIAFSKPTDAIMKIGFIAGSSAFSHAEVLVGDLVESDRVAIVANTAVVIEVSGTINMGDTGGVLHLWWGQASSNVSETNVLQGSYLRAIKL